MSMTLKYFFYLTQTDTNTRINVYIIQMIIPEQAQSSIGVPEDRQAGCRGAEPQLEVTTWHIIKEGPYF